MIFSVVIFVFSTSNYVPRPPLPRKVGVMTPPQLLWERRPWGATSPFTPGLCVLCDRPKLSASFLTQSHQVFFGRPLGLIPLTSHVIQRLTQSLSSFHSTCPNHLNLLFFDHQTDWFQS